MNPVDLRRLAPGFEHEAFGSQAVFRAALDALSRPGLPVEVPHAGATPSRGHRAAALLLLALLDPDTKVWLSPKLWESEAPTWLQFHTGCQLAQQASEADFGWIALGDACTLELFKNGCPDWPDQSATCLIEVESFGSTVPGWMLEGPGILGQLQLHARGLAADFESQWRANHSSFPQGVDVFLASFDEILGLPRTVRLLAKTED